MTDDACWGDRMDETVMTVKLKTKKREYQEEEGERKNVLGEKHHHKSKGAESGHDTRSSL
jgi:hypothetical protein